MKKFGLILVTVIALSQVLAGCSRPITGNETADKALVAFNDIVKRNLDNKVYHEPMLHWGLALPTGDKLEWVKNTNKSTADIVMEMDVVPFIKAGLDAKKLDENKYVVKPSSKINNQPVRDLLFHRFNVSDKNEMAQGSDDAMRRLLKQKPELVKFDQIENKFVLTLDGGFEVRWTESLGLNDTDFEFIIEAAPLIAAGVEPYKLKGSGWELKGDTFIKSYTLK